MRPIVFISGEISQPRIIKRVVSIAEAGFHVSVYGFDRGVYNCNTFPTNIQVNILGELKDGRDYLKKLKLTKEAVREIVDKEKSRNPIYYTFTLIGAYFLYKQKVDYVYELADVLYGYPKFNAVRPFLKAIEKHIIKSSKLTVMTSLGFKEYFFDKRKVDNVLIQPNKLNSCFKNFKRLSISDVSQSSYRFAFIGAIRYADTVLRFAKVIGKSFPNHEFHFYGESAAVDYFMKETSEFSNIYFHGKYKNPEDLASIYDKVDIVISAYHTDSLNERIAEPNKLYETIFFLKPIVVSKGTFIEKQVLKYNCGFAIDCYSETSIEEFVRSLNNNILSNIRENEYKIPTHELVDKPDDIIHHLKSI